MNTIGYITEREEAQFGRMGGTAAVSCNILLRFSIVFQLKLYCYELKPGVELGDVAQHMLQKVMQHLSRRRIRERFHIS